MPNTVPKFPCAADAVMLGRLELSRMLWEGTKCEFEISSEVSREGVSSQFTSLARESHPSVRLVGHLLAEALKAGE